MKKYVVLSKLTDEGRKTLKEKPERVKEVNEEIEQMGGKMVEQYALMGNYDFISIIETKDDKTLTKIITEMGSRGTIDTVTLPAIEVDNFIRGIKE